MSIIKIHFFLFCLLIISLISCREKGMIDNEAALLNVESTAAYNEGDTLHFIKKTTTLTNWVDWHFQYDSGFSIGSFKASGVPIHFDRMENIESIDSSSLLKELFIYSPDSSKYLDLYSYCFFKNGNKYFPGEVDQMVVIGNHKNIFSRKQVMFLGISQTAEFAEWVSNESFLIGLNSRSENSDSSQYEIFLFNLEEASYINFVKNRKNPLLRTSFIEIDINQRTKVK